MVFSFSLVEALTVSRNVHIALFRSALQSATSKMLFSARQAVRRSRKSLALHDKSTSADVKLLKSVVGASALNSCKVMAL